MRRPSASAVLKRLRSYGSRKNVLGMARYGIRSKRAFGVPAPRLWALARELRPDHTLAIALWKSKVYDARILAALIDDPRMVTAKQMDAWAADFDNWAICDGCCIHLFSRTRFGFQKARQWSKRKEEFVRRAGFALMAALTVHDKQAPDSRFLEFFPLIKRAIRDERNFVKKAVNWALRQIGKRNLALNRKAIAFAREARTSDSVAARWIASDALREIQSPAVQRRLARK